MTPELKKKWIDALQSGKFKQGQNYLVFGDKFCCLGVLRHIASPDNLDLDKDENSEMLSHEQLDRFALPYEAQIYLAELNDDGRSFDHIADVIERTL